MPRLQPPRVTTDAPAPNWSGPLSPGQPVEVRNRFDGEWTPGFEVAAPADAGYRLRRVSDGRELPAVFADADVRTRRDARRPICHR